MTSKTARLPGTRPDPAALVIDLHAPFAAPANLLGEESQYIAWSAARALDPRGSGRVRTDDFINTLCLAWSRKQAIRILKSAKAARWWELEPNFVRLAGQEPVLNSFEVELPSAIQGLAFRLADLNTRPRRTAALVAAVVGDVAPRSLAYIQRFCGVDRNTLYRLRKDPFIASHILRVKPEWAVE